MPIGNEGIRIPTAAAQTQWWVSWVDLARSGRSSVGSALNGGDITVGNMFFFLRDVTVTGIRFYANFPSYPRDIKCGMWNITQASAELANKTVTVSAEGVYIATFAPPYATGMFDTTAVAANRRYAEVDCAQFNNTNQVMNGPSIYLYTPKSYGNGAGGYSCPGSIGAANYPFPIEPIIT